MASVKTNQLKNSEQAVPGAPASAARTPDYFDKHGKIVWLIALGLIFIVAFFVFKDYLLFNKVYLFKDIGSDTMNGLYPYIYYTAGQVAGHQFPTWTFSWGMGQNIFSLLFRDPFDIFLFLGGKNNVAYGLIYKELFKVSGGGLLFYFYLRTMNRTYFTSVLGSLLFAFCGFMIVGGGWSFFSYEAFGAALLLLGFELMFAGRSQLLFPVSVFLVGISTPVNLYLYGVFLAIYAVLRCFQSGKDTRSMGLLFVRMAGSGLVGVLMAAPFIIPNIIMILNSPRGGGGDSFMQTLGSAHMFETADKLSIGTSVMRFFASDLLGSGYDFKGWKNILEAPMFYCGLPCLLLLPQVFQFLDKKVKIAFAVVLGLWLLPIVFPYFRWAFWLFSGDYYRAYSFFVSLTFLFYSLQALDLIIEKRKINVIVLLITLAALFVLINYPFFPESNYLDASLYGFVCLLLPVYAALLYFMCRSTNVNYLKYTFLALVCVELLFLSAASVNHRDALNAEELTEKKGYNDHSVEALKSVKEGDKTFYRVDKNYMSSLTRDYSYNDGMIQGYNGTSSYNSFNQSNYISYLELMDIADSTDEEQTRWAIGLVQRPILESENRVKYILAKGAMNKHWKFVCDSLSTFGDVRLLRNKYVLPIGFTYDTYIKISQFKKLPGVQKDFVSLRACIIEDNDIAKIGTVKEITFPKNGETDSFTYEVYRELVDGLGKDTLAVSRFDNRVIAGKIDVGADRIMYLSVPYDDGWKLKDNGSAAAKIKLSGGMTGIVVKKGHHDIELSYHQPYWYLGILLCIGGLCLYMALFFVVSWKRRKITV